MAETYAQGPRLLTSWGRLRQAAAIVIPVGMLLSAGCLAGRDPGEQDTTQVPAAAKIDEFFIVDCLLPGQVRQLGRDVTYVTRREAMKTSARDCRIRGGEYVAFDRSNYATALKVWLPLAEQGDSAAQTYVGEIFEKGLGVSSDYAAAAVWYRRAAESGYARAAINLGNLYELGLGVPQDKVQALSWYRRAAGVSNLSFEIVSEKVQRLPDEVVGLRRKLQEKQEELDRTQRELQNLRHRLELELEERQKKAPSVTAESRELARSIAAFEARLAAKDQEVTALRAEIARMQPSTDHVGPEIQGERVGYPLPKKGMPFGNYHALVIGNNDYQQLSRLETAINDAKEVARLLREEYGFKVTLLPNVNRFDLVSALETLQVRLTDTDNLLIYYAGHGALDRQNQRGHWQPVDAAPRSQANWISNSLLTDILNAMTVKQLLVVADSCYAGTLTRSALGRLEARMSTEETLKVLQSMAQQRARMVMTSGGVEPVIDSTGGPHSVFARPFIELLKANTGVLPGQEMFRLLQLRVAAAGQTADMQQVPEYAPIKLAGHGGGDFFFVRTSNRVAVRFTAPPTSRQ